MITSIHALIYSDDVDATRSFLRDVLGFPFVNDGGTEDGSQTVALTGKDLSDATEGVGALTDSGVATLANIDLTDINDAILNVATMRANNGAEQSRLAFASEVLTVNKANLEAANSRIVDVDVAEESTQLARWNVLVQSGTAMLAQANQSTQNVLRLLQG